MSGVAHYGKILLFGEYSLLYGSDALTIPYRKKKVMLHFPYKNTSEELNQIAGHSNKQLQLFFKYLNSHKKDTATYLDLAAMQQDLNEGLFLKSDIPSGYGLGSSGALIAALFNRFGKQPYNRTDDHSAKALMRLQEIFSFMEGFFHGKSSGIDPLSSFLNHALLIKSGNKPETTDQIMPIFGDKSGLFLIDTKLSRKTAPLVQIFKEKSSDKKFVETLQQKYIPLNNECIDALLNGCRTFQEKFFSLSDLQLRYFREMIPEHFLQIWTQGLSSGLFSLKLCGAGGGGYLLGYANDLSGIDKKLQYKHIEKVLF